MTVRLDPINDPPQPKPVKFPPATTTLVFSASADPSTEVDVTYKIVSPSGVAFANGTTIEKLSSHQLDAGIRAVPKQVRFTPSGGSAPPMLPIEVHAVIKPADGSTVRTVDWSVPVNSIAFAMRSMKAMKAMQANDPQRESLVLLRQLCDLLPHLEAALAAEEAGEGLESPPERV